MPKKLTQEEFIKKLINKYGNKYDLSKVKYFGNKTKVCLICPEHGEFWKRVDILLSKECCGCQKCGNEKRNQINTSNTEEFIKKAKKIHGDKYDYSKVEYKNSSIKVCIICPEHGKFWQTPNAHLNGKGCYKCFQERQSIITKQRNLLTTEEFVKKAKEVHGNKYDYSKVEYVNTHTKVCIICPEHGEFWQTPNAHLNGSGCQKCGNEKRKQKNTLSTEQFIKRAKEVHGDKYDYSKVEYVKAKRKICIICPEHGEFWQQADSHLHGCGCPKCNRSHLENDVEKFLKSNNIVFETEKKFEWLVNNKKMSLDFYLPDYKIAIECQGEQHYKTYRWEKTNTRLLKRQKLDLLKKELCEKHQIKIIYVKYNEKIEESLKKQFSEIDLLI